MNIKLVQLNHSWNVFGAFELFLCLNTMEYEQMLTFYKFCNICLSFVAYIFCKLNVLLLYISNFIFCNYVNCVNEPPPWPPSVPPYLVEQVESSLQRGLTLVLEGEGRRGEGVLKGIFSTLYSVLNI